MSPRGSLANVKKRSGPARAVPLVTEEELRKMPTKQLLGRLRRLWFCEERSAGSDLDPAEIQGTSGILFKDTPEWRAAHEEVKQALATREQIPRSVEGEVRRPGRTKRTTRRERSRLRTKAGPV